jgi:hypothetical protein
VKENTIAVTAEQSASLTIMTLPPDFVVLLSAFIGTELWQTKYFLRTAG